MAPRSLLIMLIYFSALSLHIIANSQAGRIIDTMRCQDCPKYSYAVYLPEKYTDSTYWPVIFIFDPGARGKMALTNFLQAAEIYGYILAASNNSRNGLSDEEIIIISNCMMSDVQKNFSINTRRIYTSGFSGGSRVASMIAMKNKGISGVIGCGAGFPKSDGGKMFSQIDYYGLIGDCDMNYVEMEGLKKEFDNKYVNFELRVFEGGHEWPSQGLLQEAVEWLELMAFQRKSKSVDTAFIIYYYQNLECQAQQLLGQGKILESFERYNCIYRWLSKYINANNIKSISDSICQTKEYLKAANESTEMFLAEQEFQQHILSAFRKAVFLEELPDSVSLWWRNQIAAIKKMEFGKDESKQKMAKRQLNYLTFLSYETAKMNITLKAYKTAAIFYQVVSWINPEDGNIFYILAKTYALDKDLNKSIRYLNLAVKKGYQNRKSIEDDPAFASFINEKKFREILEQCK